MAAFVDHPAVMLVVLFLVFLGAIAFGTFVLRRLIVLPGEERDDFSVVLTSTLTLLALLIGFSLSMAVNRYDQRKNLEEAEANAIGTEYARADLASPEVRPPMKAALVRYAHLRIEDYLTRDPGELARIGRDTTTVQSELWKLATAVAEGKPTPVGALVVAGMNDVLNSQDYSEAARINRVPLGSWILMIAIAIFGCVIQGYGAKGKLSVGLLIIILPVTVSLSLALIADIDSPRGGIIHVQPQNLLRLAQSLEH
ncbi:hypothetical protein [Paraburkholderia fynbosensis]|uniref:DUF4239 domain-containing protein n=1 Tax=Paraburkholderia fynbosensis TaxID=1200993 RepID=A0A6J5GZP4_9BURK|nr:hypothetical protein [Paraburkholderia fynbosensis]CAB3809614.1 hypothetical protein LMG27177_06851 [Paraburkholderia fynbosensis]